MFDDKYEQLVEKLSKIGLSRSQAKVYLSAVSLGPAGVGEISKVTNLHRQDIYKLLPRLENLGLITKTLGKPVIVEALSVENAVSNLVAMQKKKIEENANHLKAAEKELITTLKKRQDELRPKQKPEFLLISAPEAAWNRAQMSIENARTHYDTLITKEVIIKFASVFRKGFRTLAKNGVRSRLIIGADKCEDSIERAIEKMRPHKGEFTAKITGKNCPIEHYSIVDHREAWLGTQKGTATSSISPTLWTTDKNVVSLFEEHFEATWNNPHSSTIYPKKEAKASPITPQS
jgi:sugar-specific transcriptional regulator TrmB